MAPRLVACTKCRVPLPPAIYNLEQLRACPACAALAQIEVFPAAWRPPEAGPLPEAVIVEGEASCFYHPEKKAVLPCESCGRFLCALCDLELHGRHICPTCLKAGKQKGKIKQLENRRTLYDGLALAAAVYPLVIVWPSLIGAPIALYIAIRYWKAPSSVVPRGRWRSWLAIVIAVLTIAGWTAMFITIAQAGNRHD